MSGKGITRVATFKGVSVYVLTAELREDGGYMDLYYAGYYTCASV